MKKLLLIFMLIQFGCSYPMTTFWVKNDTEKEVHFTAGAIHLPSNSVLTLPFSLSPNDSVLVRKIGLKDDGNVTHVFGNITFMSLDSTQIKDPMNPANWQKRKDTTGKTDFIFRVN